MSLVTKSRKNLVVTSTIVLFLISLIPTASGDCSYDFDINIVAVKSVYKPVLERYQFPDFEEDTILALESLIVTNTGNCTFSDGRIEPVIISPSGKDYTFCMGLLDMSDFPLPNQTKSYLGECGRRLDEVGKWKIEMRTVTDPTPSGWGYNTRVNGGFLEEFNVRSRSEIENLEIVKWSLIALVFFSIPNLAVLVYYERKNKETNQTNTKYLKKISDDLEKIKENLDEEKPIFQMNLFLSSLFKRKNKNKES